jgi:hypothetical protein
MASDSFTYVKSTAFPNGFCTENCVSEINASGSGISVQLDRIDTNSTQVTIVFKAVLPADQKEALDGSTADAPNDPPSGASVLGQHNPVPPPVEPLLREDGIIYSVPKPSLYGDEMCDRDFRVNTSVVSSADAFEDLKMNPATNLEEPWNELSLVGVYKDDNGSMVECADQADADANATLTVFSYCAKLPGTSNLIQYEIRDGMVYVDPGIFVDPDNPTLTERFGHRAYAVIAPQIPGNQGGSVAVFDGYMGNPGLKIKALSPQAEVVTPDGPGGAAAAEVRLYLVYPPGTKLSHTFRLVTYRAPGTF